VTLQSTQVYSGYQVLTDLSGRFRIDNVTPGSYAIFATAQGYIAKIPDDSLDPPPDNAVSVSDGQAVKDFPLRLVPFGAISGRVLDENGDPIPGAAVEALRYAYSRYRKVWRTVQTATTNDRGEYRLFNLAPGRWYLEVTRYLGIPPVPGRVHSTVVEEGYPATFYPGVTQPSAAGAIEVAPNTDLREVDFRLHRTRVYHLRGTSAPGASVYAYRCAEDRVSFASLKTSPSGAFDFKGLAPGCYWLASELAGQPKLVSQARQLNITDCDIDDVTFRLEPAFSIQGTILVEEGSMDKLRSARIVLEPTGGIATGSNGAIGGDGAFTLTNVAPAAYLIRVDHASGLYLKTVRFGNLDISADCRLDATPGAGPLTMILRGDSGQLSGVARPAVNWLPLRITVAPDSPLAARLDLLHTVWPESDGTFHIEGLAPGAYKIFAWQTDDESLTESSELRALLAAKASSITVNASARTTTEVQTITAAEIEEARGRLR